MKSLTESINESLNERLMDAWNGRKLYWEPTEDQLKMVQKCQKSGDWTEFDEYIESERRKSPLISMAWMKNYPAEFLEYVEWEEKKFGDNLSALKRECEKLIKQQGK